MSGAILIQAAGTCWWTEASRRRACRAIPPAIDTSSSTWTETFTSARLDREDSRHGQMMEPAPHGVRLDIWLDIACLFRTRSEAQKACKTGRIDVNGQPAKPNRLIREGDELLIRRPYGRKQRIVVRGLAERHIAKADARELYEDLTPPPTPEEIEARKMERIWRAATISPHAPDKRERR